jgi:hypothetical protein
MECYESALRVVTKEKLPFRLGLSCKQTSPLRVFLNANHTFSKDFTQRGVAAAANALTVLTEKQFP